MLDLPVMDGDFMGRAYPTSWQTTCNVFDDGNQGKQLLPSCAASGDGVEMVGSASSMIRPGIEDHHCSS